MQGAAQIFSSSLKYWSDVVAIELRNIEAMGLAQQKMLEGWGVLAQRQAEMAQGTLNRSLDPQGVRIGSASTLPAAMIGQIEALKTAILEGQANSNILSELAARSGGEVANVLQSRMIAALDEFRVALEQVVPKQPAER
jgi:Phasin protein